MSVADAVIVINENVPMLNGDSGLIRENRWMAKKRKTRYAWLIKAQNPRKFVGRVRIVFTRYSVQEPDWDNLCASFKHLGDALVSTGILLDDKPSIIEQFLPRWQKAKNHQQARSVIEIYEAGKRLEF